MSSTLDALNAVVTQLQERIPYLATEHLPEPPEDYRLEHPVGALLVGYGGSRYGPSQDRDAMVQPRDMAITVRVVARQLDGREGALSMLDQVRQALLGLRLPGFNEGLRAVEDGFAAGAGGLWQYALTLAAQCVVIEDQDKGIDSPRLRHITRLGPLERTETELQPDGSTTEKDFPL